MANFEALPLSPSSVSTQKCFSAKYVWMPPYTEAPTLSCKEVPLPGVGGGGGLGSSLPGCNPHRPKGKL